MGDLIDTNIDTARTSVPMTSEAKESNLTWVFSRIPHSSAGQKSGDMSMYPTTDDQQQAHIRVLSKHTFLAVASILLT